MEKELIESILDEGRIKLLPFLAEFKTDFYLAVGTALALQLQHRRSEDFDFFSTGTFDLPRLQNKVSTVFSGIPFLLTQLESDTLSIILNNNIKVSFFNIKTQPILPFKENSWFRLCSELEIGAMKITALIRAAYKDYVDLYFLLKKYSLAEILLLCERKYTSFEKSVYLKALLSYNDIEILPIEFIKGKEKEPSEVFHFIEAQAKKVIRKM